jgi:hypothetical protein
MGLLSRWKARKDTEIDGSEPERQAREEVWNREVARLGRDEVLRRLAALSDYRGGRSGPSGFETWNLQIEQEIEVLTRELAKYDKKATSSNQPLTNPPPRAY